MQRLGFRSKNSEFDVNKDLPSFYNAIGLSEAKWLLSESVYYWNRYSMRLISEDLEKKLREIKTPVIPI
jgi:hypothetical protein